MYLAKGHFLMGDKNSSMQNIKEFLREKCNKRLTSNAVHWPEVCHHVVLAWWLIRDRKNRFSPMVC